MPLSDWDVLAIDEKGRSSNGTSEVSPAGVFIDPYEGVLQISGADLWHPAAGFARPQAGAVRDGDLTVLDVKVMALPVRTAAGAIRGLVWATWFLRGAELVSTAGITVRGFDETGSRYEGVTPADVRRFRETLSGWTKETRLPAAISELGTANALRFNQGDAFFARQMGHACSATPPGQADLPMLFHSQRRESIAPHLVRRDPATGRVIEPGAVAKSPKKTNRGKAAARKGTLKFGTKAGPKNGPKTKRAARGEPNSRRMAA